MSNFKKMQKDIANSKQKVIKPSDDLEEMRKKLGNKYIDDLSDTDDDNDDEQSTYKGRHNKFIKNIKEVKSKNIVVNKKKENNVINKSNNNSNNDNNSKSESESESENESESVNESIDISINEYEFKDEFEKHIREYVKIDNNIKDHKNSIKELNTKKEATQIEIMKHLERLGENYIKINGGTLRINQYESKGGLKEALIKDAILEKVKNPKMVEEIMEIIDDKRENNKKLQKSLKRTYERKK